VACRRAGGRVASRCRENEKGHGILSVKGRGLQCCTRSETPPPPQEAERSRPGGQQKEGEQQEGEGNAQLPE